MNKLKPESRINDIVLQDLNNKVLIYDLGNNKAYLLNETSAMIWRECNGNQTIVEISNKLSRKVKTPVSVEIVWLAISQFNTDKLLANDDLATPFDGLSRREIVKKIGFASMVALPVIFSVVAPLAAQAQSSCLNQPCTFTDGSQSDCCASNLRCRSTPAACKLCSPPQTAITLCGLPTLAQCVTLCASRIERNFCCNSSPLVAAPFDGTGFPCVCA